MSEININRNNVAVTAAVSDVDIIKTDDLTPPPYTEPILYPDGYQILSDDQKTAVIGDNIGHNVGEKTNIFGISPIIPISYTGNNLYDEITDSFKDITDIGNTINNNNKYKDYISYAITNNKSDIFHYSNSIYSYNALNGDYNNINNSFIMKYEDITCKSMTGNKFISLDENTNIDEYIETIQTSGDISSTQYFKEKKNYTGAFFYPDLDNISQVMTEGGERSNIVIKPGESISIPLTFEYFILKEDTDINKLSKKLIFVIKDSLMSTGKYFEIEATGNQSSNFTDSIYTSIDNYTLDDNLTDN